ncbi:MAG: hypothetical protein NT052_02135 [Candidatus Shapirobacteria bacterium]|nr:hypothetical protein [Candidatus Shapirobacteria bacterium]
MIASILITDSNLNNRLKKAFELAEKFLKRQTANNPDFWLVEEKDSIKIDQIRELQKQLSLKPFLSANKVIILSEAEKMTLPAQNSLLKILEEPPENSIIILTAQNKKMLLPTIISRCQIIKLNSLTPKIEKIVFEEQNKLLKNILTASFGQRLILAEKDFYNKEQANDFCQKQLVFLRENLISQILLKNSQITLKKAQITKLLHSLQKSLILLKANVNPRLLIENLLLSYPI